MNVLLFNRWDTSEVKVSDLGLDRYINKRALIVPKTSGKTSAMYRQKTHIVERFMNKLRVPGHRGKKHKITSGHCPPNAQTIYLHTKKAFESIEKKTKSNPLNVLIKAVENAAMIEEVASYRLGGIIARQAVVVSPQRRLDLALRYLTQGIYKSSFRKRRPLSEVIADELIAASKNDSKSFAIQERNRIEREAEGAR